LIERAGELTVIAHFATVKKIEGAGFVGEGAKA
jgi:hypothetical protein